MGILFSPAHRFHALGHGPKEARLGLPNRRSLMRTWSACARKCTLISFPAIVVVRILPVPVLVPVQNANNASHDTNCLAQPN